MRQKTVSMEDELAGPHPSTLEFVNELYLKLRADLGRKFAQKIAINMWPRHKDLKPAEAAKRWAAARAPR